MTTALVTLKGGKGSGHKGHAGIPGHVGGSLPGKGTAKLSVPKVVITAQKYSQAELDAERMESGPMTYWQMNNELDQKYPKAVQNGKIELATVLNVPMESIPSKQAWYFVQGIISVEEAAKKIGVHYESEATHQAKLEQRRARGKLRRQQQAVQEVSSDFQPGKPYEGTVENVVAYRGSEAGTITVFEDSKKSYLALDDQLVLLHASKVISDSGESWGENHLDGEDLNKYVGDTLDMQDYTRSYWSNMTSGQRGELKDHICKQIATDTNGDVAEEAANQILRQWAETSNDSDMRSLGMQKEIADEFGLQMSDWQQKNYDKLKETQDRAVFTYAADLANLRNQYIKDKTEFDNTYAFQEMNIRKGVTVAYTVERLANLPDDDNLDKELSKAGYERAWLSGMYDGIFPISDPDRKITAKAARAMYNRTQSILKNYADKDGYVTLYRGFTTESYNDMESYIKGSKINYKGNAIESWSVSKRQAHLFGNVVLAMRVPISNVLSTSTTGFGCITEGEFVIFGNVPGTQVTVAGTAISP